jgi:hypothetical protein
MSRVHKNGLQGNLKAVFFVGMREAALKALRHKMATAFNPTSCKIKFCLQGKRARDCALNMTMK